MRRLSSAATVRLVQGPNCDSPASPTGSRHGALAPGRPERVLVPRVSRVARPDVLGGIGARQVSQDTRGLANALATMVKVNDQRGTPWSAIVDEVQGQIEQMAECGHCERGPGDRPRGIAGEPQ